MMENILISFITKAVSEGTHNFHILNCVSGEFVCVEAYNVPVNNFSVMSGWSHRFLGITSTFGE